MYNVQKKSEISSVRFIQYKYLCLFMYNAKYNMKKINKNNLLFLFYFIIVIKINHSDK
jgi:hypothetical protein